MSKNTNLKEFEDEIDQEAKRVVSRFLQLHKAVALTAYRTIIEGSPVCTGRYRASHTIAVNEIDETVAEPATDPTECNGSIRAPSLGEAQLKLLGLQPFQVIWIGNALPYASALENGHSQQAANGIYGVALAQVEAQFQNVEI